MKSMYLTPGAERGRKRRLAVAALMIPAIASAQMVTSVWDPAAPPVPI